MRTTALSSRFRFTILRLFLLQSTSPNAILDSGISWMFQRTCVKRWNNTHGLLRSPNSLACGPFLSFAITLGNLRRAVLMPLPSTLKNSARGGGTCASHYVNYQDICVLEINWSLEFLEGCIFCAVWLKTCLLQKQISQFFPAIFPFVQSVISTAPLCIMKG